MASEILIHPNAYEFRLFGPSEGKRSGSWWNLKNFSVFFLSFFRTVRYTPHRVGFCLYSPFSPNLFRGHSAIGHFRFFEHLRDA